MNKLLLLIFVLTITLNGYSQVFIDTSAMTIINNNRTAAEGDLYLDTINNVFKIGLTHGKLSNIADNQNIDSIKIINDTLLAVYIERGIGDTVSLLPIFDSMARVATEWQDGDLIGRTELIYARQAQENGHNIVFTDTASLGLGTNTPTASIDVAKGDVRFRNYPETRADDTTTHLNELYTDANGNVKSARREIIPPPVTIDLSNTSTGNTFNYYNHYATQLTNAGLNPIPIGNLDFYVTYFDNLVFNNVSISPLGVLSYDVISSSENNNRIIYVVFFTK